MQNGGIIVQAVSLCSLYPHVLQIYIKGSEIHNTAFVILIKVLNPVCKRNICISISNLYGYPSRKKDLWAAYPDINT